MEKKKKETALMEIEEPCVMGLVCPDEREQLRECIIEKIRLDIIEKIRLDPQDLNRYSYARNNPLKFNDPTGLCSVCAEIGYEVTQAKPFDPIRFQLERIRANLGDLGRINLSGFIGRISDGGGGNNEGEEYCYFVADCTFANC